MTMGYYFNFFATTQFITIAVPTDAFIWSSCIDYIFRDKRKCALFECLYFNHFSLLKSDILHANQCCVVKLQIETLDQ